MKTHATYDAWGMPSLHKAPDLCGVAGDLYLILYQMTNQLTYRGYYYDFETGLYYLQSRYYSPSLCRFVNADKHFDTGDGILGTNMFIYCQNNPIMYTDPTGEAIKAASISGPAEIVKGKHRVFRRRVEEAVEQQL